MAEINPLGLIILNDFLTPGLLQCPVDVFFCRPRHTSLQSGRMSQTSTERLRDYLAQLPPQSQALLMREFERAIDRGEETTIATFVLEQLRKIARGADGDARPRTDNPTRLLFRPLEPLLVEGNVAVRSGQIRRSSLLPVWQWLVREGAPVLASGFEAALARGPESGTSPEIEAAARKLQFAAAEALQAIVAAGTH